MKVKREGRDGVWLIEKKEIIDFLIDSGAEEIHNTVHVGGLSLGANWKKEDVIKAIKDSERIAILTGAAFSNNLGHALSVIRDNELLMFDIGRISEKELDIDN